MSFILHVADHLNEVNYMYRYRQQADKPFIFTSLIDCNSQLLLTVSMVRLVMGRGRGLWDIVKFTLFRGGHVWKEL